MAPLIESVAPAAGAAVAPMVGTVGPAAEAVLSPFARAAAPLRRAAAPFVRSARGRMRRARHRWRERPGARRRHLRRIARQPLPNLFDLHPEARRAAPRELGFETLDLSSIRGTAVEGPAQRGRDFLPLPPFRSTNWSGRWQRIRGAVRRLESLPPIDVVQWDDGYWVLDGHNRVAAALYEGQVAIDAVVVAYVMPGVHRPPSTHEIAPVLEESILLRSVGQRRPSEEADGGRRAADEAGATPPTEGGTGSPDRVGDKAPPDTRAEQGLPSQGGSDQDLPSMRGGAESPSAPDETGR